MLSLPFSLAGIVAKDIAAPEFPIAYDYFLRLEVFGNRSKPAGLGEYLFLDLGNAGHARSQKVLPTGPGEFIPVGCRIHPGVGNEERPPKLPSPKVFPDLFYRIHIGSIAGKNPTPNGQPFARYGKSYHDLRTPRSIF